MLIIKSVTAVSESVMRIIQDAKKNIPPAYSLVAMNPFRRGSTIEEVIVDAFTNAMDTFSVANRSGESESQHQEDAKTST